MGNSSFENLLCLHKQLQENQRILLKWFHRSILKSQEIWEKVETIRAPLWITWNPISAETVSLNWNVYNCRTFGNFVMDVWYLLRQISKCGHFGENTYFWILSFPSKERNYARSIINCHMEKPWEFLRNYEAAFSYFCMNSVQLDYFSVYWSETYRPLLSPPDDDIFPLQRIVCFYYLFNEPILPTYIYLQRYLIFPVSSFFSSFSFTIFLLFYIFPFLTPHPIARVFSFLVRFVRKQFIEVRTVWRHNCSAFSGQWPVPLWRKSCYNPAGYL